MNFAHIFSVLVSRWKLSVLIMLCVVCVAAAVTLSMSKRYIATASVVVDVNKSGGAVGGGTMIGLEQKLYVATQVEVLNSQRVAEEVARGLNPTEHAYFDQQWQLGGARGKFEDFVVDILSNGLIVAPSRSSNVIDISFKSNSPELAASIANSFVERYVEIAVELRTQPAEKYSKFFESQSKVSRERLAEARRKLNAFNRKNGIVDNSNRVDVANERLSDLSQKVVALEAQLANETSKSRKSRSRASLLVEAQTDPILVGMRNDLQRARTDFSNMSHSLGSQHPQILRKKRAIASLRSRIGRETNRIADTLKVNSEVTAARLKQLRVALDKQSRHVQKLSAARSGAEVFVADVQSAQRTYDNILKRLNQTRLESQATQGNVSLLAKAKAPIFPSSPNVALNMAIGVFLGTMLGLCVGILLELFDRRIRTDTQITDLLDLPVIGAVPSFSGARAKALQVSVDRGLSGQPRRLPAT